MERSNLSDLWSSHEKEMLDQFCRQFYWSKENFLNSQQIKSLKQWAHQIEDEGLLREAAIGKGFKKERNQTIRSDKIRWIDNFTTDEGALVSSLFSGLQTIARSKLYLPARRFECHFAKYEVGDFYKRHSDRHSFLPGRLLTCVLYLSDLQPGEGGELILYDEDLRPIKIIPQAGRIVVFDSALEHEVRAAQKERWSLTGWIRDDLLPGLNLS